MESTGHRTGGGSLLGLGACHNLYSPLSCSITVRLLALITYNRSPLVTTDYLSDEYPDDFTKSSTKSYLINSSLSVSWQLHDKCL